MISKIFSYTCWRRLKSDPLGVKLQSAPTVKGFGWTWNTGGYEYPVFWGLAAMAVALTEFKRFAKPSASRLNAALAN
jgi:putative oxidoreductase